VRYVNKKKDRSKTD